MMIKEIKVVLSKEEYQALEEMAVIINYLTREYEYGIDVHILARRAVTEYIRIHRVKSLSKKYSESPIRNRLEELLRKRQIKKGDFAKEIGITSATLSNILSEKTEPTLDVAMRIADRLGLNVTDIFYRQ